MRRRELIASLGIILAVWPLSALGQTERTQTWPARPVKLIVGFAPGGPTDLVARLVAQKLAEETGKNFFVENVPGAGGNVGAVRAAKSSPDGYTFLVTGGNITNNQYLFADPGYDPVKDFDAVTLAAATPVVLAVNPSVPATTVKELVAWIRGNPGKESYASPGTGTPPQLVGALFQHTLQLDAAPSRAVAALSELKPRNARCCARRSSLDLWICHAIAKAQFQPARTLYRRPVGCVGRRQIIRFD
jgi:tripartite-type tricarboxylate transporter receptor subunit TctC